MRPTHLTTSGAKGARMSGWFLCPAPVCAPHGGEGSAGTLLLDCSTDLADFNSSLSAHTSESSLFQPKANSSTCLLQKETSNSRTASMILKVPFEEKIFTGSAIRAWIPCCCGAVRHSCRVHSILSAEVTLQLLQSFTAR